MTLFDPAYEQVIEKAADGTVSSTTVITSEPLVLVAPGVTPVAHGYRQLLVPPTGDLAVHADMVRIEGRIEAPGRAIKLNARVIEVVPDGAGNEPTIVVDGRPAGPHDPDQVPATPRAANGKDGRFEYRRFISDIREGPGNGTSGAAGKDGEPGLPGGAAGWIDVRCHTLSSPGISRTFALCATGGAGGPGQTGQPGQAGGSGGKGIDGWQGGVLNSDICMPSDGGKAGVGGPGGRGGAAGPGGPKGSVQMHCQVIDNVVPQPAVQDGPDGTRGQDASDGTNGTPGKGGESLIYVNPNSPSATTTYPAGQDGGYQPQKARTGEPPSALPRAPARSTAQTTVVGSAPFVSLALTAHVDQARMALDRIRHDGLGLKRTDSAAVRAIADRVSWLAGVTTAWPEPPEPIITIKLGVSAVASTLSNRFVDWFGHQTTWGPTASLQQYNQLLGTGNAGLLDLFGKAQTAWDAYRTARDDGATTASQCRSAQQAATAQITELSEKRNQLRVAIRGLARAIEDRDDPIDGARRSVTEHLAEFRTNAEHKLNLSLSQYLTVLEQTAFVMSDPAQALSVYSTEMGKFWIDAVTKVPGEDGSAVEKSWLVKKVGVLGDDVTTLDEAFSIVDGFVKSNDPNGYKLIATQRQLVDQLKYYEAIDGAVEAQKAMDEFVRLTLDRNAKVLDYNNSLASLLQISSVIATLEQRRALLETAAIESAPPMTDTAVQAVYESAKTACVETLYDASRAYRLWSLRSYDVFSDILSTDGPADITPITIQQGQQWLQREVVKDLEHFVGSLQTRRDPIVVEFSVADDPDIVTEFARDRGTDEMFNPLPHFWEFSLGVATRDTEVADSPFAGLGNVRLVEARCWLQGLTSVADASGNVKIHVIHGGDEEIAPARPQGGEDTVAVRHDPVERMFEYSVSESRSGSAPTMAAIETRALYWDATYDGTSEKLPDHTPIGPFTTWRLSVRPQEIGTSVDWSQLTGVRMEFFVRFQPFTARLSNSFTSQDAPADVAGLDGPGEPDLSVAVN